VRMRVARTNLTRREIFKHFEGEGQNGSLGDDVHNVITLLGC